MDGPVATERRSGARWPGAAFRMTHATLRPGCPVLVIDLSHAGAQVETSRPLRPGTRVHVRLVAEGWSLGVAALVLRCAVWHVHADHGVTYRGNLRFDECFALPPAFVSQ